MEFTEPELARYKYRLYFCINCGKTLIEKEMKVGPKGQVVIPQAMRKTLKIEPGSKVLFKLEGDKIILKRYFDAVAVFERIAKETNYNKEIDPHAAYEEELEERYKRTYLDAKPVGRKKPL
jgi:AbrB family looped-hinge helix DNA binding protein